MCRIVGIINPNLPNPYDSLIAMRDTMAHGGPDDVGIFVDNNAGVYLGHRRLSLIDLSEAGHQPMLSDDKEIVIVYNGEVYNFNDIKRELQLLGYFFHSSSDTEVILVAYQHWGKKCFEKFNGMFALCIYDKRRKTILLARDHAGIKPLYYTIKNKSLIFASETRAFLQIDPNWQENIEWRTLLLTFGHIPEPYTTLENVYSLSKGTVLEVNLYEFQQQTTVFDRIKYKYSIQNEADAIQAIQTTLRDAVKRHLISDAPIGLFLSGGIDSSILTILAKEFTGSNLNTLSIDFDEASYSERAYQDIIIQRTGAKHQRFIIRENEFETSINDIRNAMDQPSNDGINTYFIAKYASKAGLKAVLSGIGADELLGGYPSFKRANILSKSKIIPSFVLQLAELFQDEKKRKITFLKQKNALGQYLFNRGFFTPKQVAEILDISEKEVLKTLGKILLPDFISALSSKEQVSYTETNLYMQNQLLRDTDYMSMWHSVEVRVPFLDKVFMDTCYSIDPAIRFAGRPKNILIKAFENVLPEAIWNRPKQGFIFPFQQWLPQVNFQIHEDAFMDKLKKELITGKTHWSRFWCYYLTQMKHPKLDGYFSN